MGDMEANPKSDVLSKSRKFCSMFGCGSRSGNMFKFPSDEKVRAEWKAICKIKRTISQTMYVCYRHFGPSDLYKTPMGLTRIRKGAVPSQLLLEELPVKEKTKTTSCAVLGCGTKFDKTFHFFPRDEHRRILWHLLCRLKMTPTRNIRICNKHFLEADFLLKGDIKVLKRSAMPSQHLPIESCLLQVELDICKELLPSSTYHQQSVEVNVPDCEEETFVCGGHISFCDKLFNHDKQSDETETSDIKPSFDILHELPTSVGSSALTYLIPKLQESYGTLVGSRTTSISILPLVQNDVQMISLTGVSMALLDSITCLVFNIHGKEGLTLPFTRERVALTLCKLKLNLSFSSLGIVFGCDRRACCLYFAETLPLLSEVLKCAVCWPSRTEVQSSVKDFGKFPDTRIVLNCIEIPIQPSECLKCSHSLYSTSQSMLTLKTLVGLAPSGLVTFISDVYGGKASHEEIFKDSTLVSQKLLDPYLDAVMVVSETFCMGDICDDLFIRVYNNPLILRPGETFCSFGENIAQTLQRLQMFKITKAQLSPFLIPFVADIINVIVGIVNLNAAK